MQDGVGWHGSDESAVPANIAPIVLPPCAPERDTTEDAWAYPRGTKLAHRLLGGYDDIVGACCDARNNFTADRKTPALHHQTPMDGVSKF